MLLKVLKRADFVILMGILVTLGLSTENAPRSGKNIFADKVASQSIPV